MCICFIIFFFFFFFQAEDGIRDWSVTGVQTCALPICNGQVERANDMVLQGVETRVFDWLRHYEEKWAKKLPSRSEEHTSELQSLTKLVCRLLLEKKNRVRA